MGIAEAEENAQDRRQAEVFCSWINSRQFDNLQINNLYEDLEDGVGLLKLIDHVQPGIVDWKRFV
jgi:plastin-1